LNCVRKSCSICGFGKAGLGLGALNEIVEFIITVVVQSTGVGSYVNNALDLVFNFVGALIAFWYVRKREI